MGLFGKLVSNDNMTGYKKFENKRGWDNATLLEKLSGVTTSLGAPKMGSIKILGKEAPAVVYEDLSESYVVYVKADEKKIEIGKSPKPGTGSGAMLDAAAVLVGGGEDEEGVRLNRAIDEMQGVMDKLLAGEAVTESKPVQTAALSGDAVRLYMAEHIDLSLHDRYGIFTQNQQPVFYVEGNLMDTAYKVTDADENEVMTIKKKLVAILPEYTVYEGKKELGHFKKKLVLTRTEIVGKVDGKELTIKGDMFGHSFNIMLGDTMIGSVDMEQLTWANCYRIEACDESMVHTVVAIAVIVEALIKSDERSN